MASKTGYRPVARAGAADRDVPARLARSLPRRRIAAFSGFAVRRGAGRHKETAARGVVREVPGRLGSNPSNGVSAMKSFLAGRMLFTLAALSATALSSNALASAQGVQATAFGLTHTALGGASLSVHPQ